MTFRISLIKKTYMGEHRSTWLSDSGKEGKYCVNLDSFLDTGNLGLASIWRKEILLALKF